MAKRRKKPDLIDSRTLWLCLAWAVGAGLWLLVTAALASYDTADWPGHTVAPYNAQTHNQVGRVGAYAAHKLYLMIGPGVWIAVAGGLAVLVATAMRKAVTQPVLRVTGVIVMSLTTSAIIALGLPQIWSGYSSRPEGVGGLIALYVNSELAARFGFLGTMIILGVAFWVGAILAADQAVLALPRLIGWVWRHVSSIRVPRPVLVGSLPRLAGSLFGMAGSTAGALAGWGRGLARHRDADDELEDDEYEEEYDSYEDE
jgi:S-DNA-T family DNA segregation ATPase FtsK/SpoIIIE